MILIFVEIFKVKAERCVTRFSSLSKFKSDCFSEDNDITQNEEIVTIHNNTIARSARNCCINFCKCKLVMFPLQVLVPD